MKSIIYLRLTVFMLFFSFGSYSQVIQPDTSLRLIEKNDGTKYIAKILSDDARELLIETETIGKIYILKSEVKRITVIDSKSNIINGEFREESPFSTRYAFTNNALPIKKNEHYAMVNLFGPEVHFAVTDRLNVGVMTTWIGSPLVAVGKYTIPTNNEKVNFSVASMVGTSGYLNQFRGFGGLHWATMTFGDRKNNISISGGFGYFNAGTRNETWNGNSYAVSYGDRNQSVEGLYTSSTGEMTSLTDYQNYDPSTGTYATFEYYEYDSPQIPTEKVRNTFKAPILSVAGIRQLTNKASLFFDSMIAFGVSDFTSYNRISGGREITRDENGYVTDVTSTPVVVSVESSSPVALYIMPGMRFQKNENRAFQIAVAGVTVWDGESFESFPLPLISWFFKF